MVERYRNRSMTKSAHETDPIRSDLGSAKLDEFRKTGLQSYRQYLLNYLT